MNRQEHVEHLEAELDEWNEEIDQLEARARKARAPLEYQRKVATIKRRRDEATKLLSRLQRADDSTWEAAKGGAAELWESMKTTFEETKQAFREGLDESR